MTPGKSSAAIDPYQAEDDHRTLTRASEIQSDDKRMRSVRRHHRKVARNLRKVGRAIQGKR